MKDFQEWLDMVSSSTYSKMDDVTGLMPPVSEKLCILKAFFGFNPECMWPGRLLVFFEYKNLCYRLLFNIRTKGQRANQANQPLELEEIYKCTVKLANGEVLTLYDFASTDIGRQAFWLYTPTKSLDEDSQEIRKLFKACKRFSVENRACYLLRKAGM